MSLRRRVMLIVSILLAAVFGLNFLFVVSAQRSLLHATEEAELENVAKIATSMMQERESIASRGADIVAAQEWVAFSFRAGDRESLLEGLRPMFERLKTAYGVSIIRFFTPPANAMLFVENPSVPVTDFSATRPMIVAANLQGVSQRGLELGPAGLAVRGVIPIKDNKGLIGVVEFASDFQVVLKQISRLTDTQLATFINEEQWKKATEKVKDFHPMRDQVIEGNRAMHSTDWDLTGSVVSYKELSPVRGNRLTYRTVDGKRYGVLTMPLIDFSGKPIGFLVAVRNLSDLNTTFVDGVRQAVIRMLLCFIVSFGGALIVFNGLLLRPVTDLAGKLQALNDGEVDTPLAIPGRTDEVGAMFGAADRLRVKLRNLLRGPSEVP